MPYDAQLDALSERLAPYLLPRLVPRFLKYGTYTPVYVGATTAGTTTYTTQAGSYLRIGPRVDFTLFLIWTNATGTGNARISLPMTAANVTDQYFTPTVWHYQVTYTGTGITGLIAPNTNYIELHTPTSNAATAVLAVEAAGRLVISGFFFTE